MKAGSAHVVEGGVATAADGVRIAEDCVSPATSVVAFSRRRRSRCARGRPPRAPTRRGPASISRRSSRAPSTVPPCSGSPRRALALPLLATGDADRLLRPGAQRFGILDQADRHLLVLHAFPPRTVRLKWAHPASFEIASIGIVHLEVEHVIRDQGEEKVAGENADAPQHASGADAIHGAAQLIDNERPEARADWHRQESGLRSRPGAGVCPRAWRLSS